MGRSKTTHAGVAQTEKQDRFVRLIAQGVSNSEACRQVGINRRAGTRWRFGRTIQNTAGVDVHYAPVRTATPSTRHPRYLSLDERTMIADLRRARCTLRDIADELRQVVGVAAGARAELLAGLLRRRRFGRRPTSRRDVASATGRPRATHAPQLS